ncbi:PD-(D/E)XK nuclease family protein [Saccharicrinis sp. FJH54]|uniref:PD-(D/E)XK nuclease family protein n=1 Tax=Saccharicrinis sp. FJH54 TaxID=3344665 RepID=UPI0035D45230
MNEKEILYNFIVNNYNLEMLETKIKAFNPFKVLAIETDEIKHSNVLAWLLNPNENHGLGDYFLKVVLSQVVLMNEDILGDRISQLQIHMADFGDTVLKTDEQNNAICLKSKSNSLLFIIKNKIHSRDSKQPLSAYLNVVNAAFPDYIKIPALLTTTGDEPENNNECGILSHEILHKLIHDTLKANEKYLSKEISDFIRFYLRTLEKTLGMNEQLKALCLKIYNEHRDAIDIINETIVHDETSLKEAFLSFKTLHKIKEYYLSDRDFWFLPVELTKLLPGMDLGWRVPYPIAIRISKRDDTRLRFHIEIGPFENGSERQRFIRFLEKNGFIIKSRAKKPESKYTMLVSGFMRINDWSDKKELIEAVDKIYSKNMKEIKKIIETVKKYDF